MNMLFLTNYRHFKTRNRLNSLLKHPRSSFPACQTALIDKCFMFKMIPEQLDSKCQSKHQERDQVWKSRYNSFNCILCSFIMWQHYILPVHSLLTHKWYCCKPMLKYKQPCPSTHTLFLSLSSLSTADTRNTWWSCSPVLTATSMHQAGFTGTAYLENGPLIYKWLTAVNIAVSLCQCIIISKLAIETLPRNEWWGRTKCWYTQRNIKTKWGHKRIKGS